MYQSFKKEYLELCQRFGRDTKRKIKNDLKKDANELQWRIDYLKPKIKSETVAWLYGEIYTHRELREYEQELKYTNQLLTEI